MAGLGHRAWIPGEVITADNIQQYLMDQTVQVYANSAARGSALVGFVAEGMASYLKDTNVIEVFNGTSWVAPVADATTSTRGLAFSLPTGTSGQFLRSSGGTAIAFADIPVTGNATPSAAGSVKGVTSSSDFVALGPNAGLNNTGDGNTFIGVNAGQANTTATSNTIVGKNSGSNLGISANSNTTLGTNTLNSNTAGSFNVAIGASAASASTGSNNITIGYSAAPSTTSASNEITFGNFSNTVIRCNVTSITSLSDKRDKTDIVELPVGLQFVKDLKPVKFTWNQRDKAPIELPDGTKLEQQVKKNIPDFGFIAQDLVEAEDSLEGHDWLQLTLRNNPDQLEATQGRLIPILVKAIQELSAEVDALKAAQK